MTQRLILAASVVTMATALAIVLQRRRPEVPTRGDWPIPYQLDRDDFAHSQAPWLVAVFTSATCDTCAGVVAACAPMASPAVGVVEVEVGTDPELHRRYGIEAVPTLVVADADGVVRVSFVGPPGAGELWSAIADLRANSPQEGESGW